MFAAVWAVTWAGSVPIPVWVLVPEERLRQIARDPGPPGEEFGWRRFALPQLLDRHSPIVATIRLALAHTAWHLPLFFIPGTAQSTISLPMFTVGVLAIAIVDQRSTCAPARICCSRSWCTRWRTSAAAWRATSTR